MNIESFRYYCLSMNSVTESFPFDQQTLAFKVHHKIFAITSLDKPEFKVNLKCNPEFAIELRERYPESVVPGFHMNKKHWNTVNFESGLPEKLLEELIMHSYDSVVKGMPIKLRQTFYKKE